MPCNIIIKIEKVDENFHRKREKTSEQIIRESAYNLKEGLLVYLIFTHCIFFFNLMASIILLGANENWSVICGILG